VVSAFPNEQDDLKDIHTWLYYMKNKVNQMNSNVLFTVTFVSSASYKRTIKKYKKPKPHKRFVELCDVVGYHLYQDLEKKQIPTGTHYLLKYGKLLKNP